MASVSAVPTLLLLFSVCFALHYAGVESRVYPQRGVALEEDRYRALAFGDQSVYYGAKATISVHALPNVPIGHRSIAAMQVIYHDANSSSGLQSIQAGWQVNPDLYGDTQTRFFTHWTVDNDQQTGCFDTQCNGFVMQSGSSIAPGSILTQVSSYGGQQKYIKLTISRDPTTGDWWLTYEDETQTATVGYWPRTLFNGQGLAFKSNLIRYGGFVASPTGKVSPPMGSGHLPAEGNGKAATFKNIQYLDQYKNAYNFDDAYVSVSRPACYGLLMIPNLGDGDGVHFHYGGPRGCDS